MEGEKEVKELGGQMGTRKVGSDGYDVFSILMVVMLSQACAFVKSNQIVDFKYEVYCVSIISQ